MNIRIEPGPLRGTVTAITSKSHGHRLLIAASLAGQVNQISLPDLSQDLLATQECLTAIQGSDAPVLPCRESGSTLRFLLPVAMALHSKATFLGEGRLLQRPLSPLKEEMERHGCSLSLGENALEVTGPLLPGEYRLPGNVSSQFVTGLLFALPLLDKESTLAVTSPLESAGYVDLTLQVLGQSGIEIQTKMHRGMPVFTIPGNQKYQVPHKTRPEGDWSNGAVWLAANYIGFANQVICNGLDSESLQGDRAVAAILSNFPAVIDGSQIPDLIPVLSVVAALKPGVTRFEKAGRLRIKESDRIATTVKLIQALGGDAREQADGLTIKGRPQLAGGIVDGSNDHRIVMAAALAATACKEPVTILGAEAVSKSYPEFFRDFKSLGGKVHEL